MLKIIKKSRILIMGVLVVALCACSANASSDNASVANPWVSSDEAGVFAATGISLNVPENATEVEYSYEDTDKMAQVTFKLDGSDWVYRAKESSEAEDISGMYYEWTVNEEGVVSGRPAVYMAYSDAKEGADTIDSVSGVQVVNWYDGVTGLSYSLSASGEDLNGMDIAVYAENIFEPLQSEVTDDAAGDEAAELEEFFLGEHIRSEDESSVIIAKAEDGTFNVDISIIRLCSLENGVGTFSDHVMNFTVKDPNDNDMQGRIYRDSDNTLVVEITDSTWGYLPNGETLAGFGK